MVEDALCNIFASEVRHLHFQPGQGIDTFNFERSAVRLRIPVETLLKTVDQRVSENQDVKRAVGNWDAIFAFAEGGEDAGALTDFEKHVLNFVDGHRSVEDIATGCRDSSLNLARVLYGLARKGVVRRLTPGEAHLLPEIGGRSASRRPGAAQRTAEEAPSRPAQRRQITGAAQAPTAAELAASAAARAATDSSDRILVGPHLPPIVPQPAQPVGRRLPGWRSSSASASTSSCSTAVATQGSRRPGTRSPSSRAGSSGTRRRR